MTVAVKATSPAICAFVVRVLPTSTFTITRVAARAWRFVACRESCVAARFGMPCDEVRVS
jgi:hypothetical protein